MERLGKFLAKAGIDAFLLLLILAVFLAYLKPEIGSGKGVFSLSAIANYGISFIFFFYGLKLNREKLHAGLSNWKLHILIHVTTFILFPVLIWFIRPLFTGEETILWLGIFYLAVLPSTVSSSVVMVSIANGNIPAAIFNASISSLAGVFITPLWMSLVLSGTNGYDFSHLWGIISKLILQILLPVALGMILNRKWGYFTEKHRKGLQRFDQAIILLIVYTSFCTSFADHVFEDFSASGILWCALGMVLLFFVVYFIVTLIARILKLNREDTITAQFCGSKKSLVHGTAMSKVIFTGYSSVGIILLPIMLYHALQLMIVSAIAYRKSKNEQSTHPHHTGG
ncbi:MAG: bile acid:sodium symporter [Bacteroidales bacterium]|jgi:sodium/bile acid cotransporter 7|nr:bile acid:sodium symporter [Bacteroidales bacterium]